MLIRRCAWHREFHGYTLIHGVASWRGFSVKFTDGVCRRCVARVRAEWHLGRTATDLSLPFRLFASRESRRMAVAVALALIVAMLLPTNLITDALVGSQPERVRTPMDAREQVAMPLIEVPGPVGTVLAQPTPEADPPRVSRHRPPPDPEVSVIRYRPAPAPAPAPVVASVSMPVRPVEPRRIEPVIQQAVAVAPIVTNVVRISATEAELMSVARRHSTTRLLLAPPEDRPRHAGLAVQAP